MFLTTKNSDEERKLCANSFPMKCFHFDMKIKWLTIIIKYFYLNIISIENFHKLDHFCCQAWFLKNKQFIQYLNVKAANVLWYIIIINNINTFLDVNFQPICKNYNRTYHIVTIFSSMQYSIKHQHQTPLFDYCGSPL
jgi:hypothetical protein